MQVGGQILLTLGLLTLKVHIPEVNIEVGLGVNGSDDDETSLGRPVNGVAGLLLNGADNLEVAGRDTLLFGGEERDGGLGENGGAAGGLAGGDGDETSSVGLPSKVDDGILETVDDFDGDTLLAHTENLQVGGHGLLGLGVTVNLDTDVGTLRLPVQLDVRHVEEVTRTDDLLRGNAHQGDTGRVAADFGSPEAEQLFVLLDTLADNGGGGPLEVHNTINLDGSLAQQVHPGELVDRDRLVLQHSRDVLLVSGPLESGPLDLLLGLALSTRAGSQIVRDEGTKRLASDDIPDDDVLSVFLVGQDGVALLHLDGAGRPGGQVALTGREFDQLNERMGELLLLREGGTTPKLDTLGVDGGEVGTLGGPLDEKLSPVRAVDDVLRGVALVVPEHTDLVATVKGELVTGVGVAQP